MANNDIKLSFGVNIRRTTQNLYSELNSVVEDVGTNLNGIEMHIDTKKINTEEIVNSINSMISQFEYSLTVSNIDVSPEALTALQTKVSDALKNIKIEGLDLTANAANFTPTVNSIKELSEAASAATQNLVNLNNMLATLTGSSSGVITNGERLGTAMRNLADGSAQSAENLQNEVNAINSAAEANKNLEASMESRQKAQSLSTDAFAGMKAQADAAVESVDTIAKAIDLANEKYKSLNKGRSAPSSTKFAQAMAKFGSEQYSGMTDLIAPFTNAINMASTKGELTAVATELSSLLDTFTTTGDAASRLASSIANPFMAIVKSVENMGHVSSEAKRQCEELRGVLTSLNFQQDENGAFAVTIEQLKSLNELIPETNQYYKDLLATLEKRLTVRANNNSSVDPNSPLSSALNIQSLYNRANAETSTFSEIDAAAGKAVEGYQRVIAAYTKFADLQEGFGVSNAKVDNILNSDAMADALYKNEEILKMFSASLNNIYTPQGLLELLQVLKDFGANTLDAQSAAEGFRTAVMNQFTAAIPPVQEFSKELFEALNIIKSQAEVTNNIGKVSDIDLFNFIKENATDAEKAIFNFNGDFENFRNNLMNLSKLMPNAFSYNFSNDKDGMLSFDAGNLNNMLQNEDAVIKRIEFAQQQVAALRDALTQMGATTNPDMSITVSFQQLLDMVAQFPFAKQYIDNIVRSIVLLSTTVNGIQVPASIFNFGQQESADTSAINTKTAAINQQSAAMDELANATRNAADADAQRNEAAASTPSSQPAGNVTTAPTEAGTIATFKNEVLSMIDEINKTPIKIGVEVDTSKMDRDSWVGQINQALDDFSNDIVVPIKRADVSQDVVSSLKESLGQMLTDLMSKEYTAKIKISPTITTTNFNSAVTKAISGKKTDVDGKTVGGYSINVSGVNIPASVTNTITTSIKKAIESGIQKSYKVKLTPTFTGGEKGGSAHQVIQRALNDASGTGFTITISNVKFTTEAINSIKKTLGVMPAPAKTQTGQTTGSTTSSTTTQQQQQTPTQPVALPTAQAITLSNELRVTNSLLTMARNGLVELGKVKLNDEELKQYNKSMTQLTQLEMQRNNLANKVMNGGQMDAAWKKQRSAIIEATNALRDYLKTFLSTTDAKINNNATKSMIAPASTAINSMNNIFSKVDLSQFTGEELEGLYALQNAAQMLTSSFEIFQTRQNMTADEVRENTKIYADQANALKELFAVMTSTSSGAVSDAINRAQFNPIQAAYNSADKSIKGFDKLIGTDATLPEEIVNKMNAARNAAAEFKKTMDAAMNVKYKSLEEATRAANNLESSFAQIAKDVQDVQSYLDGTATKSNALLNVLNKPRNNLASLMSGLEVDKANGLMNTSELSNQFTGMKNEWLNILNQIDKANEGFKSPNEANTAMSGILKQIVDLAARASAFRDQINGATDAQKNLESGVAKTTEELVREEARMQQIQAISKNLAKEMSNALAMPNVKGDGGTADVVSKYTDWINKSAEYNGMQEAEKQKHLENGQAIMAEVEALQLRARILQNTESITKTSEGNARNTQVSDLNRQLDELDSRQKEIAKNPFISEEAKRSLDEIAAKIKTARDSLKSLSGLAGNSTVKDDVFSGAAGSAEEGINTIKTLVSGLNQEFEDAKSRMSEFKAMYQGLASPEKELKGMMDKLPTDALTKDQSAQLDAYKKEAQKLFNDISNASKDYSQNLTQAQQKTEGYLKSINALKGKVTELVNSLNTESDAEKLFKAQLTASSTESIRQQEILNGLIAVRKKLASAVGDIVMGRVDPNDQFGGGQLLTDWQKWLTAGVNLGQKDFGNNIAQMLSEMQRYVERGEALMARFDTMRGQTNIAANEAKMTGTEAGTPELDRAAQIETLTRQLKELEAQKNQMAKTPFISDEAQASFDKIQSKIDITKDSLKSLSQMNANEAIDPKAFSESTTTTSNDIEKIKQEIKGLTEEVNKAKAQYQAFKNEFATLNTPQKDLQGMFAKLPEGSLAGDQGDQLEGYRNQATALFAAIDTASKNYSVGVNGAKTAVQGYLQELNNLMNSMNQLVGSVLAQSDAEAQFKSSISLTTEEAIKQKETLDQLKSVQGKLQTGISDILMGRLDKDNSLNSSEIVNGWKEWVDLGRQMQDKTWGSATEMLKEMAAYIALAEDLVAQIESVRQQSKANELAGNVKVGVPGPTAITDEQRRDTTVNSLRGTLDGLDSTLTKIQNNAALDTQKQRATQLREEIANVVKQLDEYSKIDASQLINTNSLDQFIARITNLISGIRSQTMDLSNETKVIDGSQFADLTRLQQIDEMTKVLQKDITTLTEMYNQGLITEDFFNHKVAGYNNWVEASAKAMDATGKQAEAVKTETQALLANGKAMDQEINNLKRYYANREALDKATNSKSKETILQAYKNVSAKDLNTDFKAYDAGLDRMKLMIDTSGTEAEKQAMTDLLQLTEQLRISIQDLTKLKVSQIINPANSDKENLDLIDTAVNTLRSDLNELIQKRNDLTAAMSAKGGTQETFTGMENAYNKALSDFESSAKQINKNLTEGEKGATTEDQINNLARLRTQYQELSAQIEAFKSKGVTGFTNQAELDKAVKSINDEISSLQRLSEAENNSSQQLAKKNTILNEANSLYIKLKNAQEQYSKFSVGTRAPLYNGMVEDAKRLGDTIADYNAGTKSLDELNRVTKEVGANFTNVKTSFDSAGKGLGIFGGQIKKVVSAFSYMFSTTRIIMSLVRNIRELITTTIELDDKMTQLKVVTQDSATVYERYLTSVSNTAKEVGSSISDLVDSATTFARLGYDINESADLAKYVAQLQNVGDIDVSEAQDAITSIIKAFNIDVSGIEQVMDQLVTTGNNFPISVEQIAEGMNNASSALAASGNSFQESVALLTASNTTMK